MSAYIEDTYERAVVELLEGIGWENVDANDIEREFDEPLDLEEARIRMSMLNCEFGTASGDRQKT